MTMATPARPQPQPQPCQMPSQLVSTSSTGTGIQPTPTPLSENKNNSLQHHDVTPMPRSNHSLMLASTPIEEAVKLDGPEFEQIMKERARLRREKEDSHIAELRVKISRLEQALAAETKRRVEATRALEKMAREEIDQWEDRCMKEMKEQREKVDDRLEKLELRLNDLEDRWKQDSQQQEETIDKKGLEFAASIEEIRKEAETERKLRLVREGQLLQQIEAHGKGYEELWDRERQERIECVGELMNQLEANEEAQKLGRKTVEIRLEQELAQLQKELEQETLERRKHDDQITAALEKYAIQFQQSLNILNSDDLFDG